MPKNRIVSSFLEAEAKSKHLDNLLNIEPTEMTEKIHKVELKNAGVVLNVPSRQSIYNAALEAGIQLPIGCNYGGCITCAAKLLAGKVKQPGASALNRRQSQAGYILLCVAQPTSDCVVEDGVESHGELYENPFTKKLSGV